MSFNITNVRDHVRQFARNAGDSTMYTDAMVDRAVQAVCNRFVRITGCTRTSSTITLTSGSNALPAFPSTPVGFLPSRLRSAWITLSGTPKATLTKVSHASLLQKQLGINVALGTFVTAPGDTSQTSGIPTLIAFDSQTTGYVYPTPADAYTVNLSWSQPFTTWTPGSTPSPNSFNIPDDWLIEILTDGVPAKLQGNEPEHKYAAESWKKYLEFESSFGNDGDLAGVASFAEMES